MTDHNYNYKKKQINEITLASVMTVCCSDVVCASYFKRGPWTQPIISLCSTSAIISADTNLNLLVLLHRLTRIMHCMSVCEYLFLFHVSNSTSATQQHVGHGVIAYIDCAWWKRHFLLHIICWVSRVLLQGHQSPGSWSTLFSTNS